MSESVQTSLLPGGFIRRLCHTNLRMRLWRSVAARMTKIVQMRTPGQNGKTQYIHGSFAGEMCLNQAAYRP
jgi:hypothetical protein